MDEIQQFLDAYQTTIGFIGLNSMLALSVWLTLYTGQLTLGNAAFAGIAAYSSALLTMKADLPFPLALLCGALLAALVSVPLGATVFRLRGVYLAIATLAFGEVVRVAILAIPITGKGQGLVGIPPKTEVWQIFLSLVVVAAVCARLRVSTAGRAWAAIREDEIAASSQGIPVHRYKLAAFVMGALIAGWAGGLAAHFDLAIPERQVFGLIGPNGAGKTTLINLISGHFRADEGTIRFTGEDITRLPPHRLARRGIPRTFQAIRPFKGLPLPANLPPPPFVPPPPP